MHAASREALQQSEEFIDKQLWDSGDSVTVGSQLGTDLFIVADRLDEERTLRTAIADASLDADQRIGIVTHIFEGKVNASTLETLTHVAGLTWSTSRELRYGIVTLGRRALMRAAEAQGQLEQVESELFELSRLLEREPELTQLLGDKAADAASKRGLLANVIYGKVNMITEALALQVIGRPESNPIDDVANLSHAAAALRGRSVARVKTAAPLNEGQQASLAQKLGQIYGREMAIHSEVDPSLLGGMTIRVEDEVIDGSTRGRLDRLRASMR